MSTGIALTQEKDTVSIREFRELLLAAEIIIVPAAGKIVTKTTELLPALEYLEIIFFQNDLSELAVAWLDNKPSKNQHVYGSMFRIDEIPFYFLHGAVPGPFPATVVHQFGLCKFENVNEATVWILTHELYHFLARTNQVDTPNDELHAIAFADVHLEQYLSYLQGR